MGNFREQLAALKVKFGNANANGSSDDLQPATESMITAAGSVDTLTDFAFLVSNVRGQYNFNEEQIRHCEAETQDILHEIELTAFNASKGYNLVRELKKVRQDRRYYMDQNELLKYIVQYLDKTWPLDIGKLIECITGRQKAQAERQYTPRVRQPMEDKQGEEEGVSCTT